MNRLININQLRCILLLLCLGVVFSLATAPPMAAQDADFDADFEDFDEVDDGVEDDSIEFHEEEENVVDDEDVDELVEWLNLLVWNRPGDYRRVGYSLFIAVAAKFSLAAGRGQGEKAHI